MKLNHAMHMLRRPGVVLVCAVGLAMVVGTTGAVAAGTIGPHDIKRNAVHSKHIKNGTVHARDLAAGSVRAAKVAADSLTGAQINESTLGQVPDAALLAGRGPATFASSTVYKKESALSNGFDKGDGTFIISEACDPGDILLSGGPANISPDTVMVESFPSPGSTNSWTARINPAAATDAFSVVILCIDM